MFRISDLSKYFFGTFVVTNQRIEPNSKSADGIYLFWNLLVLILLKRQARYAMILLRETNFNFAKVNVKRFFKSHCQRILSVYQSFTKVCSKKDFELPKVQTQISTKHIYPFPRFELRARQNLHKCALLKAIMNHSSHFHRHTHSSDLNSSWCRARSYGNEKFE